MGIPAEHSRCNGGEPCAECSAGEFLTAEDWRIIEFYTSVCQQVAPLPNNDGGFDFYPRLEAWIAYAELAVEHEKVLLFIDGAVRLYDCAAGRYKIRPELLTLDPALLAAPE